jgi:hypothetical protein
MLFIDFLGARVVAVNYDFELGTALGGELRNQAMGVTQFRNPDLRDQVDGGGFIKEMLALQVKSRTRVHYNIIKILAGHFQ